VDFAFHNALRHALPQFWIECFGHRFRLEGSGPARNEIEIVRCRHAQISLGHRDGSHAPQHVQPLSHAQCCPDFAHALPFRNESFGDGNVGDQAARPRGPMAQPPREFHDGGVHIVSIGDK